MMEVRTHLPAQGCVTSRNSVIRNARCCSISRDRDGPRETHEMADRAAARSCSDQWRSTRARLAHRLAGWPSATTERYVLGPKDKP
jgi:hypothetical protein